MHISNTTDNERPMSANDAKKMTRDYAEPILSKIPSEVFSVWEVIGIALASGAVVAITSWAIFGFVMGL